MPRNSYIKLEKEIALRKYPFPYHAMISICSDLDETPNKDVYIESSRFLNTSHITSMGVGVDLEVGNTIYFDMPKDEFSYTNTDEDGRSKIQTLIKSGHIDCIHSFGDFVNKRETAQSYLTQLKEHDCYLEVWVDHAAAPTNLDNDIMFGQGDIPESNAYVADLLCEFGISFIWKGRVTSVVAQNAKRSLGGIYRPAKKIASIRTIFKEQIKHLLGGIGYKKYKMHKINRLIQPFILSNGVEVYEFMRANPSWEGVSSHETARDIHQVLTKRMLDQLIFMGGCSILYTHLGKVIDINKPFSNKAIKAFQLLSSYYQNGKILVATTRRVLGYQRTIEDISYQISDVGGNLQIDAQSKYSGRDLQGLTWYIPEDREVLLYINGKQIDTIKNDPDSTGKVSISIPWSKLTFPEF